MYVCSINRCSFCMYIGCVGACQQDCTRAGVCFWCQPSPSATDEHLALVSANTYYRLYVSWGPVTQNVASYINEPQMCTNLLFEKEPCIYLLLTRALNHPPKAWVRMRHSVFMRLIISNLLNDIILVIHQAI